LAIFAAGVAVCHHGLRTQQIVSVNLWLAGVSVLIEPQQANHPVRNGPHRHHRAEGQVTRPEVGTGGPALEPLTEKGTNLREVQEGANPLASVAGLVKYTEQDPLKLVCLPILAHS
jgi:hypothetical protein